MKISKRSAVTACEECPCTTPSQDVILAEVPTSINPYEGAISAIHDAINLLGPLAKSDIVARESIANLSVVLFDLIG